MTREEICNSMTVQDAVQVLKETNCYGTMDIAKTVIIKALEQQPSEDEEIIKVKKGVLKSRQGRFVIYDAKWLKEHFNTTESKIYGQPKTGYWISLDTGKPSPLKDGIATESVKCSKCDEWLTASDEYATYGIYCPKCGSYNGGDIKRIDKYKAESEDKE